MPTKTLQLTTQVLAIVFVVAGTLNLLFALQGQSVRFGMQLPLWQAGAWLALGGAMSLLANAMYAPSGTRLRVLVCLGVVVAICCAGSNLVLWEILRALP